MQDLFSTVTLTEWGQTGLRLLMACLLAALIGWERGARGRPAGLRTHIVVAAGAAGFALLSIRLAEDYDNVDASRIISYIVGGIGFLGAGAIIQSGGDIRGLTTAAGLWLTAAIGAASGLGYYPIAIGLCVVGVTVIAGLRVLEGKLNGKQGADDSD